MPTDKITVEERSERARQLREEGTLLARRIAEGLPEASPPVMAIALAVLAVRAFHMMDSRLSRYVTLVASLWEDQETQAEEAAMETIRDIMNAARTVTEPQASETKH